MLEFISFLNNRIYPQYGQCFRVPFHLIFRGCSHAQSWYSLLIRALRTQPIRALSGKIFRPFSSSWSGKKFRRDSSAVPLLRGDLPGCFWASSHPLVSLFAVGSRCASGVAHGRCPVWGVEGHGRATYLRVWAHVFKNTAKAQDSVFVG